jgi:Raf kinase inhibitor-like YbhB/YbcL family protein
MKLWSPAFSDGAAIPPRYTCDGDDVSPELSWSDVPHDTVSLALTCVDPDAPRGTFTHWLIWNLDPAGEAIGAGEIPIGARQGRNDFGTVGYRGPCPPPGHGTHHYHFTLHAFARQIALPEGATISAFREAAEGVTIAPAELVGTYQR